MANRNATQQLIKSYSDRSYKHAATVTHRGAVVAFAMDDQRRIHYAVLDLNDTDPQKGALDVAYWPEDPAELCFSREIEQVGYSVAGATALPLVKKGGRAEAPPGTLRAQEIDDFLSSTARLTADVPFHVFSDEKHIFVFRQSVQGDHPDAVYKLASGGASGDAARPDGDFVRDGANKVPLVDGTLLCDRFVLAGNRLESRREVRFRRSRHKTLPASSTDSLGAADMEGTPFFEPTQELAFVRHLKDGQLTVLQLPTEVQGVKRWELFACNGKTGRLDGFNVEVSGDGLFDTQGTQLYTSPDEQWKSAVLERQPGTCPMSGKPLVPVAGEPSYAETCVALDGSGGHVELPGMDLDLSAGFTFEAWVRFAGNGSYERVFDFGNGQDNGNILLAREGQSARLMVALYTNQGARYLSTGDGAIPHDRWMHVALTIEPSGHTVIYLDGNVAASQALTCPPSGRREHNFIGRSNWPSDAYLKGKVDEARLWKRARGQDEIRAHLGQRLVGQEPGLVGYWRFDEGSGTRVYDQTDQARHAELKGGTTWVASDAPVGDHPGMRRSSMGVQGRRVAGGLDAQLYFQQENAGAGYGEEAKPFKKGARVLLAVNTTGDGGGDPAMAMLDVAVARDGRLGLLPDSLVLPRLDRPAADVDINAVAEAKRKVEIAQTEVDRLQAQVDEYVVATKVLPLAIQERDRMQAEVIAAQAVVADPLSCEVGCLTSNDNAYNTTPNRLSYDIGSGALLHERQPPSWRSITWQFVKKGEGKYKLYSKDKPGYCLTALGRAANTEPYRYSLSGDKGDSEDQFWLPKVNGASTWLRPAKASSLAISASIVGVCDFLNNTTLLRVEPLIAAPPALANATHVLATVPPLLEAKKLEVITLENQSVELDALRAQLAEKQTALTSQLLEVGALEGGSQQDVRLGMVLLHTDPQGLTTLGGLLTFLGSDHAPRLHESATGRMSCYYRDTGGQLMVGYYDTLVQRSRFAAATTQADPLLLEARLPSHLGDQTTLTVAPGGGAQTCTITLHNPAQGIRETWPEVPRAVREAAAVLQGAHESYDYEKTTVEPADKTLRGGSLLVRPLQGPATATLVNGTAALTQPGHLSQWVGDAPGQAYYFNGTQHRAGAPEGQIQGAALTDDFTLELWANPLLNHKPAHLVHHRGTTSGYLLGLEPQLIRSALQLNGTDEHMRAVIDPWTSETFTVELWLKPNRLDQPASPGIFCSTDDAGTASALHLSLGADGHYRLKHAGGDLTIGAAAARWQHLAVTHDGHTLRAYLDGRPVAAVEQAGCTYVFQAYVVGANAGRSAFFGGQLDELRVWSYARSPQEVSTDRLNRLQGDEPGLHSYYRFDLTQALDLTAEPEHGAYHGTPALVTSHSVLQGFRVVAGVALARPGDQAAGEGGNHPLETRQFVMSHDVLTQHQWHHLALRFHQGYALRFTGQGGMTVPHSPPLNLTGDLTIEIFAYLPSFSGTQTLLTKGSTGMGDDQSLPYALQVTATGHLQALLEEPDGRVHTFAAHTPLTPGFHRIALVRKGGTSRQTRSQSQTYSYTDPSGNVHNIPIDMIEGVDTTEWHDYVLYADGNEVGRHRHAGEKALGNNGPLLIGTAGRRQHLIGTISEVRLWARARETQDLGRPIRGSEQRLTAFWTFGEQGGNVAYDGRGDHHGQIVNVQRVKSPDPLGSTVELLHNGVPLAAQKLPPESPWMAATLFRSAQLTLGGQVDAQGMIHGFTGTLEEVRLWRVRRTQEQIMDNLFDRIKEEKQDLLAYYTFDEASTGPDAARLQDNSLRGLHLVWPSPEQKPRTTLSDAPVSHDAPAVRSALAGVFTAFHQVVDGRIGVEEYGDLQTDEQGGTFGVLKRAYAYLQDGRWVLFTGYKVGSLVSEWIGQAQFDPQVVGFLEGIPPMPSENLTAGQMNPDTTNWADMGVMGSVELVESDTVSLSLGSTTESSTQAAFDASLRLGFDTDFLVSIAPFGFGSVLKAAEVTINAGVKGHFESSGGWSNAASLGTGVSRARSLSMAMGGGWESPDSSAQRNPALGRRLLPNNVGFALVQSETADIFALRLAHNQRLVSFRMVPNPDIPKDWNLISFPVNPRYTKQGTLDGRVGYDSSGAVVYDSDYAHAAGRGEYSYYKPREAYAVKRRIQQAEQERLHYFATQSTGVARPPGIGSMAGQAAALLFKDTQPDVAKLMAQAQASAGGGDPTRGLPARHARRDLANTYVWTADGGFYAETTETTDVRTETAGGSFSISGSAGVGLGIDFKVFGVGVGMEFEASMGGGLSAARSRSRESEKTFQINLNLDVPGDLQRYHQDAQGNWAADGSNFPGKVDAYRFMTFYLDAAKENFEDLFGKVIDPIWLAQSDAPNAVALRQANQSGKKPACWRVFHRVTFVSRILPDFADPTAAPLEAAMLAESVGSNWQLVQRLEPFVKNRTGDAVAFADAVRAALTQELPELVPHADSIVQFLHQYYGVA